MEERTLPIGSNSNNRENGQRTRGSRDQARYWMVTIPHHHFTPFLPNGVTYIIGQLELGEGGFLHWQVVAGFKRAVRKAAVRKLFGPFHCESTDSEAAEEYCWKEDTRVEGTQFKLGSKALKRNCEKDWDAIRQSAKDGKLEEIPADVYIRSYSSLKKIASEFSRPQPIERVCKVFVGPTGTGKSRRAWEEATFEAYPKGPTSKFWDGYRGQENVVIDEFRGQIEVSLLLYF